MAAGITSIERLPEELLIHIAEYCDAISALRWSATSRRIRAATNDSLVFKNILVKSQHDRWCDYTLDIDAIARRCGQSTTAWARYVVADHRAYMLLRDQNDRIKALDHLHWIPELFVVKHPLMHHPVWRTFEVDIKGAQTKHMWCKAVAALAHEQMDETQIDSCTRWPGDEDFVKLDSLNEYLQGFHWTILELRRNWYPEISLSWPNSPLEPEQCIEIPRVPSISLHSSGPRESLPLPFSGDAGSWDAWNEQHSKALVDELTDGVWQGFYFYYSSLYMPDPSLDAPMTDIKFHRLSHKDDSHRGKPISIFAEDCHDGVGDFRVRGNLTYSNDKTVTFTAFKEYYTFHDPTTSHSGCDWSLKLTSFGLIGYWGVWVPEGFARWGNVWLWKAP